MTSPHFLKDIIGARFRRHSHGRSTGATGWGEELAPELIGPVLDEAALEKDELPVLASFLSPNDWVLVTTSRVVLSRNGQLSSLRNDDIQHAECDVDACLNAGETETDQLTHVSVKTSSGDDVRFRVLSGGGYRGIVSVLSWFAARNSPQRREKRGPGDRW